MAFRANITELSSIKLFLWLWQFPDQRRYTSYKWRNAHWFCVIGWSLWSLSVIPTYPGDDLAQLRRRSQARFNRAC